eukprot:TRINITY_DN6364_c0_g1_i2.p1 TRINITY_DN6364_c0_g1~~TRINITY_DN6364_c0_g1_i2.p1  ORF type:complete len:845 (-),score=127.75 TRINITY_DN6364_c0_g1_i2:56-2590(-)
MDKEGSGRIDFPEFMAALDKGHQATQDAGKAAAAVAGRIMGQAASDAGDNPEQAGEVAGSAAAKVAQDTHLSPEQVSEATVVAACQAAGDAAAAAGLDPEKAARAAGQAAATAGAGAGMNPQHFAQTVAPVLGCAAGRAAGRLAGSSRDANKAAERASAAAAEAAEGLGMTSQQVQEAADAAANEALRLANSRRPGGTRQGAGRGRSAGPGAAKGAGRGMPGRGAGRGRSPVNRPSRPEGGAARPTQASANRSTSPGSSPGRQGPAAASAKRAASAKPSPSRPRAKEAPGRPKSRAQPAPSSARSPSGSPPPRQRQNNTAGRLGDAGSRQGDRQGDTAGRLGTTGSPGSKVRGAKTRAAIAGGETEESQVPQPGAGKSPGKATAALGPCTPRTQERLLAMEAATGQGAQEELIEQPLPSTSTRISQPLPQASVVGSSLGAPAVISRPPVFMEPITRQASPGHRTPPNYANTMPVMSNTVQVTRFTTPYAIPGAPITVARPVHGNSFSATVSPASPSVVYRSPSQPSMPNQAKQVWSPLPPEGRNSLGTRTPSAGPTVPLLATMSLTRPTATSAPATPAAVRTTSGPPTMMSPPNPPRLTVATAYPPGMNLVSPIGTPLRATASSYNVTAPGSYAAPSPGSCAAPVATYAITSPAAQVIRRVTATSPTPPRARPSAYYPLGTMTAPPMTGSLQSTFDRLDVNHDGVLSREEFAHFVPQTTAIPIPVATAASASPVPTSVYAAPVTAPAWPSTHAPAPMVEPVATSAYAPPVAWPGQAFAMPPANAASVCPACGNIYAPDAVYCRRCGQKREQVAMPAAQAVSAGPPAIRDLAPTFDQAEQDGAVG